MPDFPVNSNFYQRSTKGLPPNSLLNLYAEPTESAAGRRVVLHGTPGLQEFVDLGEGDTPVQGIFAKDGAFNSFPFAVCNNKLFRFDIDGNVQEIGEMPNLGDKAGPVRFANSDTELVILGLQGKPYLYDGASLSEITVSRGEVTDVAHIGGYFVYVNPFNGEYYFSEVLDAADIGGLNFATAEDQADGIVACEVLQRDIWFFGRETIEIWNLSGSQTQPFVPRAGSVITRGILARDSLVKANNGLYFMGEDRMVYTVNGFTLERISTHAIEEILESLDSTNAEDIYGWQHTWEGHKFVCWAVPGHGTLCFDIVTGLWHQRSTLTSNKQAFGQLPAYRVFSYTYHYNAHFAGGTDGKIYELKDNVFTDGDLLIKRQFTTTLPIRQNYPHFNLALDMSRGFGMSPGNVSGIPPENQVPRFELEISDNLGRSWEVPQVVEFGDDGDYDTVPVWRALGQARPPGRTLRFTITDPTRVTIWGLRVNDRDL